MQRSPRERSSLTGRIPCSLRSTRAAPWPKTRRSAQCLRCHALKGAGGNVGPDLAGIGARQTREFLLESILFPNKVIAPGFETVVVVLKSGASHAGIVKSESEAELALNTAEDGIVKLKKADIAKRERGLSAMPEGVEKLLSKRELRDLVEYLATLKQ